MKIKRQTKKQYYNRDKQCIICNKPTKTYNAKTCSKYCREVVTQLLVSLNAIYLQCSWCDKLVIRRPNKVRGHETNVHNTRKLAFCDKQCHNSFLRYVKHSNYRQDNSKTKKKNYGPNWSIVRNLKREASNYCCHDCGIHENEYGKQLSIHHIKPFVSFDTYQEANQLNNLVALCEPCHRKRHSGENSHHHFSEFGANYIGSMSTTYRNKLVLADLITGLYTYEEISKRRDISYERVKKMNTGLKVKSLTRGYEYPISRCADFHHKYHNRVVDIELLPRILNDILYSTKSYKEIADELGLKQHNVAAIARGELYNELHNYKTPMR